MRRILLGLVVVIGTLAGTAAVAPAAERGSGSRDLEIRGSNPDGNLICGKWCGVFEVCC